MFISTSRNFYFRRYKCVAHEHVHIHTYLTQIHTCMSLCTRSCVSIFCDEWFEGDRRAGGAACQPHPIQRQQADPTAAGLARGHRVHRPHRHCGPRAGLVYILQLHVLLKVIHHTYIFSSSRLTMARLCPLCCSRPAACP